MRIAIVTQSSMVKVKGCLSLKLWHPIIGDESVAGVYLFSSDDPRPYHDLFCTNSLNPLWTDIKGGKSDHKELAVFNANLEDDTDFIKYFTLGRQTCHKCETDWELYSIKVCPEHLELWYGRREEGFPCQCIRVSQCEHSFEVCPQGREVEADDTKSDYLKICFGANFVNVWTFEYQRVAEGKIIKRGQQIGVSVFREEPSGQIEVYRGVYDGLYDKDDEYVKKILTSEGIRKYGKDYHYWEL